MPLHDYECRSCHHTEERFVWLKELYQTQFCPFCLCAMKRLMPAPRIQMDYPGYSCPVTGKWIEGRRAHKENLKRHDCRVLEPGEREVNERRRKEEEARFEETFAETAARTVASWPAEKQAKLCQEMEHGLDVNYSRIGASNG
jgi:putative FmdB family regulatory protein